MQRNVLELHSKYNWWMVRITIKNTPSIKVIQNMGVILSVSYFLTWCACPKYISTGFYIYLPHSSTLAWKIPWMEQPGRLQSMGSLRVGHDWATSLSFFTLMHWRRKWQPTPVFLPVDSQGRGSLVGCRLWGRTESDTTDAT